MHHGDNIPRKSKHVDKKLSLKQKNNMEIWGKTTHKKRDRVVEYRI